MLWIEHRTAPGVSHESEADLGRGGGEVLGSFAGVEDHPDDDHDEKREGCEDPGQCGGVGVHGCRCRKLQSRGSDVSSNAWPEPVRSGAVLTEASRAIGFGSCGPREVNKERAMRLEIWKGV